MSAVLQAESLTRVFPSPGGDIVAVQDAELAVSAGELVVVAGRSGAGKTTLLTMLGGLDRPTAGRVLIDGTDLADPATDILGAARLAHGLDLPDGRPHPRALRRRERRGAAAHPPRRSGRARSTRR